MKNFFEKLLLVLLIGLFTLPESIAQEGVLKRSDSLFTNKKYTEAYKGYLQIFSEGKASPAMLTKMSFIQEGLGNYAEALYYLNLYYKQTSDKQALDKMREIAKEHDLTGYEYSDFEFFLNLLQKYLLEIIAALLAISVFLTAYTFSKKRKKENPVAPVVFQVVVVLLIGVLINGFLFGKSAIVADGDAILMTGPSAGAEPIGTIEKGHRVEVLNEGDVWNRIMWEDRPVYVRSKNLRTL